jgi:hypothetical protein
MNVDSLTTDASMIARHHSIGSQGIGRAKFLRRPASARTRVVNPRKPLY